MAVHGSQGYVTYSGVLFAKGATYTQSRGMNPDNLSMRVIPQSSSIAATGTVALVYKDILTGIMETISLPDCLADKSNIWLTDKGFLGTITFQDRRWKWSRYPLFSAHFNERDAEGEIIEASKTSLREILRLAFLHIGESSVDVSRVDQDFFPELAPLCDHADEFIASILKDQGLDVCLGFGADPVVVWPLGEGTGLPSGVELMAFSEALDPPDPPYKVDVCFGPSVAQARFKLEAVGLDTDGEVKLIDDLSYKPTGGWEKQDMSGLDGVTPGTTAAILARQTVFRVYAITGFTDGTLNLPDGSGPLEEIAQVLPLLDKLVETETYYEGGDINKKKTVHPEPRVYGVYQKEESLGHGKETEIGDEVGVTFVLNVNLGMVKFEKAIGRIVDEKTKPADLYLECAFRIRSAENRQFIPYVKETVVNGSGYGTHAHKATNLHARTIVSYNDKQEVTGASTNETLLDAYVTSLVNSTAGLYASQARQMGWYYKPMSTLRNNGVISQIKHVITDGTDGEPGHHTVASSNMSFDMFARTAHERIRDGFVEARRRTWLDAQARKTREEHGND